MTAHGMGVAHRDVKPVEFIFGRRRKRRQAHLKVVDFGIAKVMTDSEDVMRAHEATGESIHAFSPKYGAPEQFDRKFGATGPWTDVYALALVLVEVVAGKTAMKGDTSQLFVIASNKEERPTLKAVGVDEGDAVEKVLARALAVDTRTRYARAGEFWDALRHAVEHGETVLSERSEETRREGASRETEPADKTATKPSATQALAPKRGSRLPQLAVAAFMACGGAALLYSVLPHQGMFVDAPPASSNAFPPLAALSKDAEAPAVNPASVTVTAPAGYQRYEMRSITSSSTFRTTSRATRNRIRAMGEPIRRSTAIPFASRAASSSDRSMRCTTPSSRVTKRTRSNDGFCPNRRTPRTCTCSPATSANRPFIIKVIVTGGTFARLYMTYKQKEQPYYEPIVPHTRDSFSFTAVSNTTPAPAPVVSVAPPHEPRLDASDAIRMIGSPCRRRNPRSRCRRRNPLIRAASVFDYPASPMAKRFRAAVIGGSGYGGGELIRRLLHPSRRRARARRVDRFRRRAARRVHPNLEGVTDLSFEGISPAEAAKGMDVVLLGLPHKVSAHEDARAHRDRARASSISPAIFACATPPSTRSTTAPSTRVPSALTDGTFVYGLPELNREAIKKAKYVASPGCFATTIELALLPLAKAGLLEGDVEVVGITGSSGSGVAPSAGTHHPVRAVNLRTYKPLDHQHIPEIDQTLATRARRTSRSASSP